VAYERENAIEKEQIKRFYTSDKIEAALSHETRKPYTIYKNNENA
jgi:hypothetical protein